nr:hypothetical protein CFP56_43791 [Quercus suber]
MGVSSIQFDLTAIGVLLTSSALPVTTIVIINKPRISAAILEVQSVPANGPCSTVSASQSSGKDHPCFALSMLLDPSTYPSRLVGVLDGAPRTVRSNPESGILPPILCLSSPNDRGLRLLKHPALVRTRRSRCPGSTRQRLSGGSRELAVVDRVLKCSLCHRRKGAFDLVNEQLGRLLRSDEWYLLSRISSIAVHRLK